MPPFFLKYLIFGTFIFMFLGASVENETDLFQFKFKGKTIVLPHRVSDNYINQSIYNFGKDTMSNVFYQEEKYIEIIRQDDALHPNLGIALGFEFDESNGEYPYTPANAVAQLKDFAYGGVQFDHRDTCNYTGVSNDVSDDITIEIDGFENDTIFGRFSGLLLNGAGKMASIDEGQFKLHVVRVK
jgi:hypothetical protein